jgi:predicted DNA-binding antitoxin AbrB/MazE fold protein
VFWKRDRTERSQDVNAIAENLHRGGGLRGYTDNVIPPGAQTERRGDAEAGECFAWRRRLTGRLFLVSQARLPSPRFHPGGHGGILQVALLALFGRVAVMAITVEAVYENGVLKPTQPLPFREQARVQVTVSSASSWVQETAGILPWPGSPEELRRFAEDPELDYPPSPEGP